MATFRIGGADRKIRPLNFHWMDSAWPALKSIMDAPPPPDLPNPDNAAEVAAYNEALGRYNAETFGQSIDAILTVVALGLEQEHFLIGFEAKQAGVVLAEPPPAPLTKDELRMLLQPDEMQLIHNPIFELLQESGMRVGEQTPAGGVEAGAGASTGTSTG